MNREQAKQWLSAYVEGMDLGSEQNLREALRLAETDPELRDWWHHQQEMDQRMRAALADVPVPDGLEQVLLTSVGAGPVSPGVPAGFMRWRGWILAAAALLVLGLGTFLFLRNNEALVQDLQASVSGTSEDSFDQFRDGMAYYIRKVYFQLDHKSDQLPSIEDWLQNHDTPAFGNLPGQLAALPTLGCKQLEWRGQKVSLVCFNTRDGKIVHLFILDREGADPDQFRDIATVARSSGLETGGWLTPDKVYLLVGSDPEVDIEFALG